MRCEPCIFLEDNNITVPTFLNFDKLTLSTEDNAHGYSSAPIIGTTFDNNYIHILHDTSNQCMYIKFIPKLIGSKSENHAIILETICLLLI